MKHVIKLLIKSIEKFYNQKFRFYFPIRYRNDPWLWDLDWSTQSVRFLKSSKAKPLKKENEEKIDNPIFKIAGNIWQTKTMSDNDPELTPSPAIQKILDTYSTLTKIQPHMPGYPR